MTKANVLITGISTGIGRAAALYLAQKGFSVYGTVRKQSDADTIEALQTANIKILVMDVTNAIEIESVKNELAGLPLAGLINNAGIALSGPLKYLSEDKIRKQFDVNVFGLLKVTQAFIPNLELNKEINSEAGRIINISSISGLMVTPFTSSYSASKYAVEALSDGMRRELMHSGIRVCIIEPGPIKTNIWEKAMQEDTSDFKNEYGMVLDFRQEYIQSTMKNALPVDNVSIAIFKALTDKNPKIRQLVTRNAGILKVILKLPDSFVDYFARKRVKLGELEKKNE